MLRLVSIFLIRIGSPKKEHIDCGATADLENRSGENGHILENPLEHVQTRTQTEKLVCAHYSDVCELFHAAGFSSCCKVSHVCKFV